MEKKTSPLGQRAEALLTLYCVLVLYYVVLLCIHSFKHFNA